SCQRRADLGACRRDAAIERVSERFARRVAIEKRKMTCRPDRRAGITWDRRYPEMEPDAATPQISFVIALVEVLKQPHVRDRIEGRSAREDQLVASVGPCEIADNVKEHVLEHHLRGGGFV